MFCPDGEISCALQVDMRRGWIYHRLLESMPECREVGSFERRGLPHIGTLGSHNKYNSLCHAVDCLARLSGQDFGES